MMISFVVLFAIVNVYVIRYANNLIQDIETKKDMYMNHANKDSLTNVYSRHFLKDWYNKELQQIKSIFCRND